MNEWKYPICTWWPKRTCNVYHNVALTHLADVTRASSIRLLGSRASLWRSLGTWWGVLLASYHLQTHKGLRVEFAGFWKAFTYIYLNSAEKLDTLVTRISSCLDVSPNKRQGAGLAEDTLAERENPLGFQLFQPSAALWLWTWGSAKTWDGLTHRVERVNPVSNKPGLTLVNPATRAANVTTPKWNIRTSHFHMCMSITAPLAINLVHTHIEDMHTQTYFVLGGQRGPECVVCLVLPAFKQLLRWSGSNVDSWRPVVP